MSRKVLGTAVAAVFATAIASAQTTSQDQQREPRPAGQMVTIEGCLQQQPGTSAATIDDATFVLQHAQVRSGREAVGTSGETAGTAGTQPDARAGAGRDRDDSEAVGTSGAGSVTGAASYKIKGLDDEKLAQHAGQRVQLQGHIESRGAMDHSAMRHRDAAESGRDRSDAEDPQAQTPQAGAVTQPEGTTGTGVSSHGTTGATAHGAGSQDHGQAAAAGELKTFNATSVQRISGECPPASR